jgi:hypothetical protein
LYCVVRELDLRQSEYDLSWTGNHGCRSECICLRNHGANAALNNKQLFGDATQLLQNKPDLFDANRLTQLGVNHEHAIRANLRITSSQQLGDNVISWFQHRADGWYLRRLIGYKMNKHLPAKSKPTDAARPLNVQKQNEQ